MMSLMAIWRYSPSTLRKVVEGAGVRGYGGARFVLSADVSSYSRPIIQTKPFLRLVNGGEELIIADGLQEEVEGTHLVTLEGVFLKGGGEDDARFRGYHVGQFHAVEIGHLDVEEEQIGLLLLDGVDGLDGVSEGGQERQVWRLGNEGLQEFDSQRLVVDDDTGEGHFLFTVYSLRFTDDY